MFSRRFICFLLVIAATAVLSGCNSVAQTQHKLSMIEQRHNVSISVESWSNADCIDELLDRIDSDLSMCPEFFKSNIGPICIKDSLNDAGAKGMMLAGYVSGADSWEDFPINLKKRTLVDRLLFPMPREEDVFLHEATHSFELNIKDDISDSWQDFQLAFSGAQQKKYNPDALFARAVWPFNHRPKSMASAYGSANHYEDFAETHCYLRRNDIEKIKISDPALYQKCKIVEVFTATGDVKQNL